MRIHFCRTVKALCVYNFFFFVFYRFRRIRMYKTQCRNMRSIVWQVFFAQHVRGNSRRLIIYWNTFIKRSGRRLSRDCSIKIGFAFQLWKRTNTHTHTRTPFIALIQYNLEAKKQTTVLPNLMYDKILKRSCAIQPPVANFTSTARRSYIIILRNTF